MWYLLLLPLAAGLGTVEPPPPLASNRVESNVREGYFDVRLNHFDASNTDVFPMRYYLNMIGSQNIVIYVGGEWQISPGWLRGGLAYEIAIDMNAALFYTEHRYYGKTRPTNSTSAAELRFLTVDQALGDLAQFIQIVKSDQFENGRYRDAKVILVGCSYAGSMATWMRLAYPHLVDVVVSDSGPLYAQEDFPEYLEVITEALRVQGCESCVATIEDAMKEVVEMLETPNGPAWVANNFNTCASLEGASPLDLATFFWFGVTETFAYLVQYATPGDIERACSQLQDTAVSPDPATRLARWVSAQQSTQPCIEARYSQQVQFHTNISYDAPQATMRLWTYQTCVEYGWYQTTTSSHQPFLSTVPLEYFHQMCRDFFASTFTEDFLRAGIERTNLFFGGRWLPERVLSVVGGHDPWSPMGPTEDQNTPMTPVYVVPQISHCRAIQSPQTISAESEDLALVQYYIRDNISYWLTGTPVFPSGSVQVYAMRTVIAVTAIITLLV